MRHTSPLGLELNLIDLYIPYIIYCASHSKISMEKYSCSGAYFHLKVFFIFLRLAIEVFVSIATFHQNLCWRPHKQQNDIPSA